MNYVKHYDALIFKARTRKKPEGYVEKHHILPSSLGGSDDKANLVWLTAREHFLAHFLLAKIHGGSQWYAVMMFKAGERRVLNSRLYEISKVKHAEWMSKRFKGLRLKDSTRMKISKSLLGNTRTLGSKLSLEHKFKISLSLVGNTNTAGKVASLETRNKMSKAHSAEKHHYFGKSRSNEVKVKISNALKGSKRGPMSEETKARIRAGVLAANFSKRYQPQPVKEHHYERQTHPRHRAHDGRAGQAEA